MWKVMEGLIMKQRQNILSTPTPFAAWEALWSHFDGNDSRTEHKHTLAAVAPSAIAVLSMSIVTVVIIVLIVTTVASAGLLIQSQDDTWSRWSSSPVIRIGDNGAIPSSYAAIVEEQIDAMAIEESYANEPSALDETLNQTLR
jgi:hypothetical protein